MAAPPPSPEAAEQAAGLTDALKDEIQAAYRAWLAGRGFQPRRGQREMIAAIARTLATDGPRRCVVEAGTGTGKTAAYCLAAIPVARAREKRVVIATATVALQEQVLLRDLPDLQRHGGLDFSFALAKGRGRYLCVRRLEERIAFDAAQSAPLFEPPGADELAIYERLRGAFARGEWDGDVDSWNEGLERQVWAPVTNDRAGCSAGRCGHYHHCPFFRARREAADAEVVVANHDLVLADLGLGGGVVLPPPEDTIYVLDEAHHLPAKTREHFTASVRLRAASEWVAQVAGNLEAMSQRFERPQAVDRARRRFGTLAGDMQQQLAEAGRLARELEFPADAVGGFHRFPLGEVPAPIGAAAGELGPAFGAAADLLEELHDAIESVLAGELEWENGEQAEDWLAVIGQLRGRANAGAALFQDYASGDAPAARWATLHRYERQDDVGFSSAPLDPGAILGERLWQRCFGAVATSATLCALGRFERFLALAGLDQEAVQLRIASPFDFPRIAVFAVPAMRANARDPAAHTEEVAALLPALLAQEPSALVLCTSWRQFNAIVASLPEEVRKRCRLQDAASKQRLVADHRQAVDAGEPSYLIGLASFAEGVDLPGDYCRHVILAKLPFATPDDPVEQAVAETIEQEGGNPFAEIVVPDTSLKLVQACGRLIRHESDRGRITLLDRRIVSAPYGEALLAALPPYRLEVD